MSLGGLPGNPIGSSELAKMDVSITLTRIGDLIGSTVKNKNTRIKLDKMLDDTRLAVNSSKAKVIRFRTIARWADLLKEEEANLIRENCNANSLVRLRDLLTRIQTEAKRLK